MTENAAGVAPLERRVRPRAWEVRQGARTYYVSDAEFVRSSYDSGSFTPLYGPDALANDDRYRWLRDNGSLTWVPFRSQWKMDAAQCDAAIDAEMQRAKAVGAA